MRIRILQLDNTKGFRFDYGTTTGGQATAPSTAGLYTFLTWSRPSASVATTTISSSPVVRVKGTMALNENSAGSQVVNKFTSGGTATTSAQLFRFKLTPSGETASTTLIIDFTTAGGISAGDFANTSIIVDANGNGNIDAGETTGAFGTPTISGSTMSFTSTTTISVATDYILRSDVNNIANGDTTTLSLSTTKIISYGATSRTFTSSLGGSLTTSGSVTNATHTRTDATPPTVSTEAETGVGVSSATLNGNITATGGDNATERGFAWGTDSSFSTHTATTSQSGDFGTGTFSKNVSGLLAGVTYYFRAYATNPNGTGYGGSDSFTAGTNTTPSRKMRLFQSYRIRVLNGRIHINQQ